MDPKVGLELIEKLNKEYIELLESKEYTLGKKIYKFEDVIKHLKFKSIIDSIKLKRRNLKTKKYSNIYSKDSFYCKSDIRYDNCVVYSCVTGNYDNIKNPLMKVCDYKLFTDDNSNNNVFWDVIQIPEKMKKMKGNRINRYYKMHPHELFREYDFSIYIDGNVQIVSDIRYLLDIAKKSKVGIAMHLHHARNCVYDEAECCKILKRGNINNITKQMKKYKNEGFPSQYGLLEATIIVVDLKNSIAKKIMNEWYQEFLNSESERDQLALPYILWKNHIMLEDVGCLGNNLLKNPMFRMINLGSHKFK